MLKTLSHLGWGGTYQKPQNPDSCSGSYALKCGTQPICPTLRAPPPPSVPGPALPLVSIEKLFCLKFVHLQAACVSYTYVFETLLLYIRESCQNPVAFGGVADLRKSLKTQILARARMRLNAEPNQFVLPLERPPLRVWPGLPSPGNNRKVFYA